MSESAVLYQRKDEVAHRSTTTHKHTISRDQRNTQCAMLPLTSSTCTIDTWSTDISDVSSSSHSDFEDIDLECPIEITAEANHSLERNISSSSRKSKGQHRKSRKSDKKKSHSRSLKKILGVLIVGIFFVGCLFLLVVHIGAKHQADRTFRLLETVQRQLYSGFTEGEVCAFGDRGPASNIRTFSNKDAAHEAGYKVLHCGACGACSTWENLRIEWATRNYLAAESARCAKKSLLGGQEAVTSCLEQPPITRRVRQVLDSCYRMHEEELRLYLFAVSTNGYCQ